MKYRNTTRRMESIDNNQDDIEDIAQITDKKSEIEDKVAKILELLKNNGQDIDGQIPDDSMEKTEIVGLIHELQNEYNNLYSKYDHFRGEITKKVQSKGEKENSSTLVNSDSEYNSSNELEIGDDEFEPELGFKTPPEFQSFHSKMLQKDYKSTRNGKQLEDSTLGEASSQIKELEGQLSVLKMDLESIRKDKDDLQVRFQEKETEARQLYETNTQLSSQISELQIILEDKGNDMDLEFLRKQKETEASQLSDRISELEMMLKEKGNEISELTSKMSGNEKDLNSTIETLTKLVNKESALVKALKDEAKTLLEEITEKANSERNLLKEKEGFLAQIEDLKLEVNSLHDQKNELEETIHGKEREKEKPSPENEASTRIIALEEQVNNLQQELDSAQRGGRKWKTNSAQNLTEFEIEEQNKNLKDKDDSKLHKTPSLDIQKLRVAESPRNPARVINHHTLERKIVDHADKFQMKVENQMRLLAQRIRVAEQIQTESKESYKKIVENLEHENKQLYGKNFLYEAQAKKITEMFSESGNSMLLELDSMAKRIDKEHENFVNRISGISNKIQFARNWITGENGEFKKLKENIETKENSLNLTLQRKLEELEEKLRERDENYSIIGEEKREAIRQLCYQIDYHRHCYDELKQKVSRMSFRWEKQDD